MRLLFFDSRTYLDWLNDNYWWPVILCVVIVAVGFYFIYFYKPKPKLKPLSEEEVIVVKNLFGGKDNIEAISKDGKRFNFILKKVDECNLKGIKDLGCTGVFVSGSQVKLIFPFDADILLEEK
ncbi:hypothetical protein RJI07_02050 [Mycoplasmatota bacterium WC30]